MTEFRDVIVVPSEDEALGASHALAGRIPIPYGRRIITHYSSFMLTNAALGSASYAYLIGAQVAMVGCTRIALGGYVIGLLLGAGLVTLAGGTLPYRFGVDTVDASKACLGTRGALVMLAAVVMTCLGWGNVLLAMTSRGLDRLLFQIPGLSAAHGEHAITLVALVLIVVIWVLLRWGARMMETIAMFCGTIQVSIAFALLLFLAWRWGLHGLVFADVPPAQALTADRHLQLTLGVEFGMANALSLFPFLGGMIRLVRHRRHIVGPIINGVALLGATTVSIVGAYAAATTGKANLADQLDVIVGTRFGPMVLAAIMITNLGTMVAQFYIAGVSIQQLRALANLRWELLLAALLVPSLIVAFLTGWLLDHVMTILAYCGVIFVGMVATTCVDTFVLRRQRVVAADLFAEPRQGAYWFVGGFNWAAIVVILAMVPVYLALFDPVSLSTKPAFAYLGASIPTLLMAGALYYGLMRAFVIPRGLGGYADAGQRHASAVVQVGL